MTINSRINEYFKLLSETDFIILEYVMENKKAVSQMSIHELADFSYTSAASIVRLAKKLHFSGFSEFKYYLKQEMENRPELVDNSIDLLKTDIENTLQLLDEQNLNIVCQKLKKSRRIFAYGTDWGEKSCVQFLKRNFLACHLYIQEIPSVTELFWSMTDITPDDLIIIFSYSGAGSSLNKVISQLRTRNIPILSVTPLTGTFLSSVASYRLHYKATLLNKTEHPDTEYNFFTTLHVLIDYLFRYYYDNFFEENKKHEL